MRENQSNLPRSEVKQLWKDLHESPEKRKQLRPEIFQSWERCYGYQVPPGIKEITYATPDVKYYQALQDSKYLLETAIPVMTRLANFVRGTGGFMVNLGNTGNINLKSIGDDEAWYWANRANVVEGMDWSENQVGTNAAALSILLRKPFSVLSYEHFCLFNTVASMSFAPIFDNGNLIGNIGISARFDKVSYHTLGMAVTAADQIQSTMMLNRISQYYRTITDSMKDGILVINMDGVITYMNSQCYKILDLDSTKMVGCSIQNSLGRYPENHYFIDIVTKQRSIIDESVVIQSGKIKIRCHITCIPLPGSNPNDMGSMIIIREDERINKIVGKWIGRNAKMTFDDIVGTSSGFQEVINMAKTTALSDSNILLQGKSGTGKDIIAQAVHNESPRKNNPFLAINCAALPRELMASELFGYEEGAFTGARKGGNAGKFELADQGTLFLDEIGDVPIDLQVSLLRVLEEKGVLRLGGNKLMPVNVRIIAATNKNLEEEIAHGRFRQDLYYRLGVIKLGIPPLRERRDDIPLLVDHFLRTISKRFGKPMIKFTPLAMQYLINYDWPGNIRELQNVLEGVIQLATDVEIDYSFITNYLKYEPKITSPMTTQDKKLEMSPSNDPAALQELLLKNKYNISKTAKELGVSRQTLYRKLHKYGLF